MNFLTLTTTLGLSALATAQQSPPLNAGAGTLISSFINNANLPLSLDVFPSILSNGTTANVSWSSSPHTLDAAKIFPINDTSYQWWWFDVVSPDASSSVVLIFYTATNDGFALLPPNVGATSVAIVSKLPNGTVIAENLAASEAVVASGDVLDGGK
jgi:hypothetical protein